jgi:hypothetical protein
LSFVLSVFLAKVLAKKIFAAEKSVPSPHAGVYILENTLPPLGGGEISADVIWGKKYEKAKRKKGKI